MNMIRRWFWSGVPLLLLACLLQALLSIHLCTELYKTNGPFYDSLDYHLLLAEIVSKAQMKGVVSALQTAMRSSTVFLPMAMGALIGPFVEIHRSLGVWIQLPWIVALVLSARQCLIIWLAMNRLTATFASLLFVSIQSVYYFNGGLSDFRMDLSLYLLFGCSVCWFLIALKTKLLRDWVMCGIFCSLCCLSRATAPVYLAAVIGGVSAVHLAFNRMRVVRAVAVGLGIIAGTMAVCAGWFYYLNYNHLHYYYVVWNPDANANLPLSQSFKHVIFALINTGPIVLGGAIGILAISIAAILIIWKRQKAPCSFSWENLLSALIVGAGPIAFLVLRGAGHNPFVSMPGAFGIVLFILTCASFGLRSPQRSTKALAIGCALFTAFLSAYSGAKDFGISPGYECDIKSYYKIVQSLETDARQHRLGEVRPVLISLAAMTKSGLKNTMLYDMGYVFSNELNVVKNGILFDFKSAIYDPSSSVEWNQLPVKGEKESISYMAMLAQNTITHLIVPDEQTLEYLETHRPYIYANSICRRMRDAILGQGKWELIKEGITVSPEEHYHLYANRMFSR